MSALHERRLAAARRILSGETDLHTEAAALDVSPEVLEGWAHFLAAGVQLERGRRQRQVRQVFQFGLAVAVAVGVGLAAPVAWAQVCTPTLPAPLTTFCPNQPAVAAEVNQNFKVLADAIVARTGGLNVTSGTITTQNLNVANTVNSATGAVTGNNTAVLEARDNTGHPRLELRGSGASPYIDLSNDTTSDFDARIMLDASGVLQLSASGVALSCRQGFTAAADGRVCVGGLVSARGGHTAIDYCRSHTPAARVCTHNDLMQACGSITNFSYGASSGWYGDQTGDDSMLVWNTPTCANGGNNTGPSQSAINGPNLPFRCCY